MTSSALCQAALPSRSLSRRAVAALDAARALAACYVIAHHVAGGHDGIFKYALKLGQEAVLIFFLLSGFVIFANEKNRVADVRGYYTRRIRRIYPTLLVAMIVSLAVAAYTGDISERFRWSQLIGTLLGLQDLAFLKPGVIVEPFMGNGPLWSLSYELAFYAAFPTVFMLWKRWPRSTSHGVGLVSCLSYLSFAWSPNHWSLVTAYFLVWWSGAMAADAYLRGRKTLSGIASSVVWLTILSGLAAFVACVHGYGSIGVYPLLPLRHFAAAIFVLVLLFGPIGQTLASQLQRAEGLFAFIASISYGLYVLHVPLLVNSSFAHTITGFPAMLVLLVLLAYFSDRRLSILLRPKSKKVVEAVLPVHADGSTPPATSVARQFDSGD